MSDKFRGSRLARRGVLLALLVILLATVVPSGARPLHRRKRVSDQRLAELETLLALSKMRGKLVTVPVGFGRIDPQKLGRRRRALGERSDTYGHGFLLSALSPPGHNGAEEMKTRSSHLVTFSFDKDTLRDLNARESMKISQQSNY
ncbi:uncharacterized protein LOC124174086 [Ischnura elegans]|uniref:uncharacterized protein LOC124174086 n=1 Tax=Ischnura elegans TaxID=197161 RepID=UPI001ED8B7BB|nr:uncharacterized protein LOC124174086 [Ischnura elegans]